MDDASKARLTAEARVRLDEVREHIRAEIGELRRAATSQREESRSEFESEELRMFQQALAVHSRQKADELERLYPSPYFTSCEVAFADEPQPQSLSFGKFSFDKDRIYSWTAPVGELRFEEPGPVSYLTPEGVRREGVMLKKDQYMIVDGKIIFLASEAVDQPRELIYQEYLSSRKTGFALPEIVAQMEKAQDQVIRAHHRGPFLISGPAGSGKTTLALHRVAYLTQSPDTAKRYPSRSIVVFVQDTGTKEYFSHLLPELGIHNVTITTFAEWALGVMGLTMGFVTRYGPNERERDRYEYLKSRALREQAGIAFRRGAEFASLERFYRPYFSDKEAQLFKGQQESRVLDRYDLAVLLAGFAERPGLTAIEKRSVRQKSGLMREQVRKIPLEYSLMVVDEFQNYLPEQLKVMRSCLSDRQPSVLYVGDLAQQVQFGSLRDWEQIGEAIEPERAVTLHKVYRNTKNILRYLERLGYEVEVPDGVREGIEVVEASMTQPEEVAYAREVVERMGGASVGILAKDPDYLAEFQEAFHDQPNVHCMSMREAQGVEFEAVCIVGIDPGTFAIDEDMEAEYFEEASQVAKDVLYVALTRAISELHVLGRCELSEVVSF